MREEGDEGGGADGAAARGLAVVVARSASGVGPAPARWRWRSCCASWFPRAGEALLAATGFDLAPYHALIMGGYLMTAPGIVGMVIGFLLLDERDARTLTGAARHAALDAAVSRLPRRAAAAGRHRCRRSSAIRWSGSVRCR